MQRQWPQAILPPTRTLVPIYASKFPQPPKLPPTRNLRQNLRGFLIALTTAFGTLAGMEFSDTPLSVTPPTTCVTLSPKIGIPQNRCITAADYAKYTSIPTSKNALQPYRTPTQEKQRIQPKNFALVGDSNRDGKIDDNDFTDTKTWTWQTGPFILFNMDDDDKKGRPDWQDRIVNGPKDEEDLSKITLQLAPQFQKNIVTLIADPKSRPYINVFQKTTRGWVPVTLDGSQPLPYTKQLILGVEAKQFANRNWNGLVTLQAVAKEKNKIVSQDTIEMRVSPWLMVPNTAKVKELYVSDVGMANREFVSQLRAGITPTGAKVNVVPGGTTWKQDTMEIGYVQFPKDGKMREFNVVLNGLRPQASDFYPRSLLSKDFGWFQVGKPRRLDALNQWTDWFGNLEVTPPIPGYSLGRIYYGNAGSVAFHPDVIDFLKAQEIQGPPLDIDTSWLAIRHVDEIISFIPTPSGKPLMMIVSPEEGVKLLKSLDKKGHKNELINRGLSSQTTVSSALQNKNLIEYNLRLQAKNINAIEEKVKREFNLTNDQIIRVPAMFDFGGSSWWPNMVNSVVVNGRLMVSNPRGAIINGKDFTQEEFRRRVAASALTVYFLNDRYYQELRGNTHCATNTRRDGVEKPFWESLPERLNSQQVAGKR
ncbi:MAG TPA: protein-arginine deiminase family protein [Halomicronema sp.]